jgi:hypothetical protein
MWSYYPDTVNWSPVSDRVQQNRQGGSGKAGLGHLQVGLGVRRCGKMQQLRKGRPAVAEEAFRHLAAGSRRGFRHAISGPSLRRLPPYGGHGEGGVACALAGDLVPSRLRHDDPAQGILQGSFVPSREKRL